MIFLKEEIPLEIKEKQDKDQYTYGDHFSERK